MTRKKRLPEQVVVVAGASYGLGRAIAVAAARRGADVVIGARTRQALDGALAEIEAAGANGLAVAADVSRREQVAELVDATVERFGRIDTYVANAMVTAYAEAHRLEDEELRRVFDVNFFGSVYGYWAALPHLCESHGRSSRSRRRFLTAVSHCRRRTAPPRPPCAPSSRARESNNGKNTQTSTS